MAHDRGEAYGIEPGLDHFPYPEAVEPTPRLAALEANRSEIEAAIREPDAFVLPDTQGWQPNKRTNAC